MPSTMSTRAPPALFTGEKTIAFSSHVRDLSDFLNHHELHQYGHSCPVKTKTFEIGAYLTERDSSELKVDKKASSANSTNLYWENVPSTSENDDEELEDSQTPVPRLPFPSHLVDIYPPHLPLCYEDSVTNEALCEGECQFIELVERKEMKIYLMDPEMSILTYEDYEVKSEDSDEETDDGSESDQGESFTTTFSSADQWILSEDSLSHPSPATKGSIALLTAGLVFLFRVTLLTILALPRVVYLNSFIYSIFSLLQLPSRFRRPEHSSDGKARVVVPYELPEDLDYDEGEEYDESDEYDEGDELLSASDCFEDAGSYDGGESEDDEESELAIMGPTPIEAWLYAVE